MAARQRPSTRRRPAAASQDAAETPSQFVSGAGQRPTTRCRPAAASQDAGGPPGKRRRRGGAAVLPPPSHLERPQLRLREAEEGGGPELLFRFRETPACEVWRVDSREDLAALLAAEAAKARASCERWIRHPQAQWIEEMIEELTPARREALGRRHRGLQSATVPEADLLGRWAETSDFASVAVNLWLEDKSLEEVLARAEQLGHLDRSASPGCILEGKLIGELATARDLDFGQLLPMVKALSPKADSVPCYRVCPRNCFEQDQSSSQRLEELRPGDGQGSLNTTWDYEAEEQDCGVDLLDEFHEDMDEVLSCCDQVRLNQRMYLIWKFPHYMTSYHQDTHVPPHITFYNQVSGVSLFHFLPTLVGLYVTQVGRRDVAEVREVLTMILKLILIQLMIIMITMKTIIMIITIRSNANTSTIYYYR